MQPIFLPSALSLSSPPALPYFHLPTIFYPAYLRRGQRSELVGHKFLHSVSLESFPWNFHPDYNSSNQNEQTAKPSTISYQT